MLTDLNKEEEYYQKKLYHSYSSLNLLLYSPRSYYERYILGIREEKMDAHLVAGKLIHSLLLDEKEFDNSYVISPSKLPEGNNKMIVERIYNETKENDLRLEDCEEKILAILTEISLHQSLKTDKQRIDKILNDQNLSYFEFLRTKGSRAVIDQEMLEYGRQSVSVIKDNVEICNLMGLDGYGKKPGIKVINETLLKLELTDYPFGLKTIPDNYVVDDSSRTVYINDLKNTAKTIADFKETVEYYRYGLQAAIQILTIMNLFPEYNIVFHFIVIDKYLQVYPFQASEATLDTWAKELEDVLIKAKYHYQSRNYQLPYIFATNKVLL